jgi:hypothetical protein
VLDDRVDFFVQMEIIGVNRVDLRTRKIDERLRRRFASRGQRVHASCGLHPIRGSGDVAALDEGAIEYPIAVSFWLHDKIAVGGQVARITRRNKQIFAALTFVGTREPHVCHPTKIGVIDGAENARRNVHDHRPFGEVQTHKDINRGGIRCEKQRTCVHQVREYSNAAVTLDTSFARPFAHGIERRRWYAAEKGLNASRKVEVVIDLLDCLGIGKAVEKLQPRFEYSRCPVLLCRKAPSRNILAEAVLVPLRASQGPLRVVLAGPPEEFASLLAYLKISCASYRRDSIRSVVGSSTASPPANQYEAALTNAKNAERTTTIKRSGSVSYHVKRGKFPGGGGGRVGEFRLGRARHAVVS